MTADLPAASILGIGAITPMGRDLHAIAQGLAEPSAKKPDVLRVSDELLADSAISKNMRRADRFSRMAVLAAIDACSASKAACDGVSPERIGMILSTGFGPHCRGFRFLSGLLDNGDDAASPTDFSHSVHGAALAYVSEILGLRGPSLTVTDFENGFHQAVMLAQCWLADGACDRVLVGAVDELGDVMLHCTSRMTGGAITPGEGAMFLMLGPANASGLATIGAPAFLPRADLKIDCQEVAFHSCFGRSASEMAFAVLGVLMQTATALGNFNTIALIRNSTDNQSSKLLIRKP